MSRCLTKGSLAFERSPKRCSMPTLARASLANVKYSPKQHIPHKNTFSHFANLADPIETSKMYKAEGESGPKSFRISRRTTKESLKSKLLPGGDSPFAASLFQLQYQKEDLRSKIVTQVLSDQAKTILIKKQRSKKPIQTHVFWSEMHQGSSRKATPKLITLSLNC
jgi:hypothetical protein